MSQEVGFEFPACPHRWNGSWCRECVREIVKNSADWEGLIEYIAGLKKELFLRGCVVEAAREIGHGQCDMHDCEKLEEALQSLDQARSGA